MPIKFNSTNRVLPNNVRAEDVATDTINRILDVQARRYQAAFRPQGFLCTLYHPLTGGQRCACVGRQQIVAGLLDEQGNAKPGFINELLTGEQFDISPYGVMPAQGTSSPASSGDPFEDVDTGAGPALNGASSVPPPGWLTPHLNPNLPQNQPQGGAGSGGGVGRAGRPAVELIIQDDSGNLVYTSGSTHAPIDSATPVEGYQTPSTRTGTSGVTGNGTVQPMPYSDAYPGAGGNEGIVAGGQLGVADEESAFDWVQQNLDHFGCTDAYGPDAASTGHAQHKNDRLLGPMTSYSDVYSNTHQDPRARTIVPQELSSASGGVSMEPMSEAVQAPPNTTLPDLDSFFDPDDADNPALPEVPGPDYTGPAYGNPLPAVGVPVGDLGAVPFDPSSPVPPDQQPGTVGSDLPRLSDYPMPVQTGTAAVPGRRPTPIVSHSDSDTFEQLAGTYQNPNAEAESDAQLNALLGEAGEEAQRQAEINGAVDAAMLTGGGDALAALSDAKCPVCFGNGYVGGYRVYNGWRNVQSPATNPNWLGDSAVNWQAEIPTVDNCSGVEFKIILPVNCVGVDAFNVRNGKEVVPADLYVDDKRLRTEADLARFCDGRRHTLRAMLRRPTTVTHVEVQVNQSREWVLFEFPRVTKTSATDVIDITGQVSVNAPPMIADIRPRCVFVESTYGKPFLVMDVPTWNDRRRSILGWDFEARVIQPTELMSYLPKRLHLESQNRIVQVRDNGPGYSRRT